MNTREKIRKIMFYQEQKRLLLRTIRNYNENETEFFYYNGRYTRFSVLEEKSKEYLVEENKQQECLNKKDITGYSEEGLKEVIETRLDEIERNQRVKELVTPSTYFFDSLFIGKMSRMSNIEQLKENVYNTLCQQYTNIEIEEKAASCIKSKKDAFTGTREKMGEDFFAVFSIFNDCFCIHAKNDNLHSFTYFGKDREKAIEHFETLCRCAYNQLLKEATNLARGKMKQ